jgi:hypothetical protein
MLRFVAVPMHRFVMQCHVRIAQHNKAMNLIVNRISFSIIVKRVFDISVRDVPTVHCISCTYSTAAVKIVEKEGEYCNIHIIYICSLGYKAFYFF